MVKFWDNIFSIKNDSDRLHKIVRLLGIKFKFRRRAKIQDLKLEIIQSLRNEINIFRENQTNYINKNMEDLLKKIRIDMVDIIASQKTNEKIFKKYKNINANKEIAVIAPGTTLNCFTPLTGIKYIGLNRAVYREDIDFDYFFMQDYIAVKDYVNKLSEKRFENTKKFFGIMKDYTYDGRATIPESVSNRIGAERYCIFHQWEYFNYLFPRDISCAPLATATSVAGSAIQFALYTNPKRIYLVGCDCSSGYFNDAQPIDNYQRHLYDAWVKVKEFADIWYPETEIVSINPVGLKGMFKDVYTESYLSEHSEIRGELGDNIEILSTEVFQNI